MYAHIYQFVTNLHQSVKKGKFVFALVCRGSLYLFTYTVVHGMSISDDVRHGYHQHNGWHQRSGNC